MAAGSRVESSNSSQRAVSRARHSSQPREALSCGRRHQFNSFRRIQPAQREAAMMERRRVDPGLAAISTLLILVTGLALVIAERWVGFSRFV